jgi:hypothetical protein
MLINASKILTFTSVYFFETSLFNELRSFGVKNFAVYTIPAPSCMRRAQILVSRLGGPAAMVSIDEQHNVYFCFRQDNAGQKRKRRRCGRTQRPDRRSRGALKRKSAPKGPARARFQSHFDGNRRVRPQDGGVPAFRPPAPGTLALRPRLTQCRFLSARLMRDG